MFVEPGADGRYPELPINTPRLPINTPRRHLEDIWARLIACENCYDPKALGLARCEARAAMNHAVNNAVDRGGMSLVSDVMRDVDSRGWH